jgi:hypothetical protein
LAWTQSSPEELLNWRPVVDYEVRESEIAQIESEIEWLDALNSKIDALLSNSSTSWIPPQNMPGSSEG